MEILSAVQRELLYYEKETGEQIPFSLDAELSHLSTMRCGGIAACLLYPKSLFALSFSVSLATDMGLPYWILGHGSNTLFLSGRHEKLFLSTKYLTQLRVESDSVAAECGVSLFRLFSLLSEKGFSGYESLYGIPGSVGGAVLMNAGAYGAAISDHLESSLVWNAEKGKLYRLSRSEHEFGYRRSLFQEQSELVLLESVFRFPKDDPSLVRERMRQTMEKRRAAQPLSLPSLGSIFRKEGDTAVSRMIDELGLRGFRHGGAEVSKKHAGFIVNREHATPEDVVSLMETIQERVLLAYGILPKPEIKIVR